MARFFDFIIALLRDSIGQQTALFYLFERFTPSHTSLCLYPYTLRELLGNHTLQTMQNDMWKPLLFDATLKHMLYCSRNLHTINTDQDAKRSVLKRKTTLLNFQDHTNTSKTTKFGQDHSRTGPATYLFSSNISAMLGEMLAGVKLREIKAPICRQKYFLLTKYKETLLAFYK